MRSFMKFTYFVVFFGSLLSFILTINYLCFKSDVSLFSYHPSLTSFGWLSMIYAILLFSKDRKLNYTTKKTVHWIFQCLAVICAGSGFIIIILVKNSYNKPHFQTWHSLFGLVSIFSFIPSIILGLIHLKNHYFRVIVGPYLSKQLHWLFGVVTFLLFSFTIILSVYSDWINNQLNSTQKNALLLFITISTVVVLKKPINLLYTKITT